MTKTKKTSQPIYLTPAQREFVKEKANYDGLTMNAFIVGLIVKEMNKK